MPDKRKLSEIIALLGDLSLAATQSGEQADQLLDQTLNQLQASLSSIAASADKPAAKARAELANLIDFEQGTELRDFFQNVATSLLEAQKQLDQDSLAYSRSAAALHLPPSRFSIPSVRAELRFGFSNLTSKGFNVFVYGNQQQAQKQSESSISFDLVATPPEPIFNPAPSKPQPQLASGSARDRALDQLNAPKEFHRTRALASVFDLGPSRQLVLWPAKSANMQMSSPNWSNFLVAHLENGAPSSSIFEHKAAISAEANLLLLNSNPAPENLGDALMTLCRWATPAAG